MLTYFVSLRVYVPTCLACLHSHVPTCLAYLRAHVPYVPKCSRAMTLNNKNKFSVTCFTQIFGIFSLPFSCEIKLYMKSIYDKQECLWKHLLWEFNSTFRHFSYQAEAFDGCCDKLCTTLDMGGEVIDIYVIWTQQGLDSFRRTLPISPDQEEVLRSPIHKKCNYTSPQD